MSIRQPSSLVKFCDANTANYVLAESTLRWSAPCLFDDPFELNHHSSLSFDSRKLLIACVKSTMGLIFSRDDPKGSSPLIKAIRRWRTEERFDSEDEAQEVLSELLTTMVQHREPEILQLMTDWRCYSRNLRILCMTEKHDQIGLWERYGGNHSGIAIRFACGEDTSLEDPQAVRYQESKPEITSLGEQMDILMNQEAILQQQTDFSEKFLSKSKLELKDREWRLLREVDAEGESQDDAYLFEDLPFESHEVRAIYFGAAVDPKVKQDVSALAKRKYSKAKLFQAHPHSARFELEFERIDANGMPITQ